MNNFFVTPLHKNLLSWQPLTKHKSAFLFAGLFASTMLLKYCSVFIPSLGMNLSLATIPLILTGVCFGPVVGFVNGIVIDLLAFWLLGNTHGFSFLFLLQSGLYGLVSGLSCMYCYKNCNQMTSSEKVKNIVKIVVISSIINSLILGTLFAHIYLPNNQLTVNFLLFTRLIKETIKITITVFFLFWFLKNK